MLMNITKYLHTIIQLYNYKLGIIIKDVTDNCHMNAFLFNTLRTLLIANENCVVNDDAIECLILGRIIL